MDRDPVMFILHPSGKSCVVYNREVLEKCLLYKKGDRRFDGLTPLNGNTQHYYTCEVLKEHRKAYARSYLEE